MNSQVHVMKTGAFVIGLMLIGLLMACTSFGEIPPGMEQATFAVR